MVRVAGLFCVAGVVGVASAECGWCGVFGMAYRYRTEPKLRNTGNTYTAKCRIRIGIDRTARLQPCLLLLVGSSRTRFVELPGSCFILYRPAAKSTAQHVVALGGLHRDEEQIQAVRKNLAQENHD